MADETQLVVTGERGMMSPDQLDVLRQTIAKKATPEEFEMFVAVCRGTGLNPFAKEIYFIKFESQTGGDPTVAMPIGIDGLRRKGAESGDYGGQVGPFWCGPDGEWKDIWLDDQHPPHACKVGIVRKGNPEPTWGIVKWSEFNKVNMGKAGAFWRKYPTHQMAVRAESHAWRKACPRLVEKLESLGGEVLNADYLIAKAEQIQRERALPQHIPPRDIPSVLYGKAPEEQPTGDETPKAPERWTTEDLDKLQKAVVNTQLSNHEWRKLLGLEETAGVPELMGLGTVDEVITLLHKNLAKALAETSALATGPGVQQMKF